MRMLLLESNAVRDRSPKGAIGSVLLHAGLIALAVLATARVVTPSSTETLDVVRYVPLTEIHTEPQPLDLPRESSSAPRREDIPGGTALDAPVFDAPLPDLSSVPVGIPDITLDTRIGGGTELLGRGGIQNGPGDGGGLGGTGVGRGRGHDNAFDVLEVERAAQLDAARSPRPAYPAPLRNAGIIGRVDVEYVVDTTGRYETGSLKIVGATHELFEASVKSAMPKMRFFPAEVGGRKVRQLVRQSFHFTLD